MREFSISIGNQSVTGTLIFINPAAAPSVNLEFLRYWVGQTANANSAQQRIQLMSQATGFPSGVTSTTPTKLKPSDPNASVIAGTTGQVTAGFAGLLPSSQGGGAETTLWDDGFNVLNGWLHVPTPPETRVMPAGYAQGLALYFPAQPATPTGWAFGLVYREV